MLSSRHQKKKWHVKTSSRALRQRRKQTTSTKYVRSGTKETKFVCPFDKLTIRVWIGFSVCCVVCCPHHYHPHNRTDVKFHLLRMCVLYVRVRVRVRVVEPVRPFVCVCMWECMSECEIGEEMLVLLHSEQHTTQSRRRATKKRRCVARACSGK